jgi:glycosyltransferase 2 family protein
MKRNSNFLVVAKAGVSIALLFWILQSVDTAEMSSVWGSSSKMLLILVPAPILFQLYMYAIRWGVFLRNYGMQLSLSKRYLYYIIGLFFNTFFPGNLGGDVVRVGCAASVLKIRYYTIATLALVERIMGLSAIIFLGAIGIYFGGESVSAMLPIDYKPLMVALLVVLNVAVLSFRRLSAGFEKVLTKRNQWDGLRMFFHETSRMTSRSLFQILLLSLLGQLAGVLSSIIALKALHIDIPFLGYLVMFSIVSFATLIPISLGGFGVREGLSVYLLGSFGVSSESAVSFALIWYIRQIVVGLAGGCIYGGLRRRERIWFKRKDECDGNVACNL